MTPEQKQHGKPKCNIMNNAETDLNACHWCNKSDPNCIAVGDPSEDPRWICPACVAKVVKNLGETQEALNIALSKIPPQPSLMTESPPGIDCEHACRYGKSHLPLSIQVLGSLFVTTRNSLIPECVGQLRALLRLCHVATNDVTEEPLPPVFVPSGLTLCSKCGWAHAPNDACVQIGARKMIPAEEWHLKMADRAVYADREGMKELIREIQHNAQDVLQEKARVLCETTNPPSGGYDWIDELGGLFRVMRMQRDSEMKTLETYRAKLDQAQRERDELERYYVKALADLKDAANAAHIEAWNLSKSAECSDVDSKMADGSFGKNELNAHRRVAEFMGFHNLAYDFLNTHTPLKQGGLIMTTELEMAFKDLREISDDVCNFTTGSGVRLKAAIERVHDLIDQQQQGHDEVLGKVSHGLTPCSRCGWIHSPNDSCVEDFDAKRLEWAMEHPDVFRDLVWKIFNIENTQNEDVKKAIDAEIAKENRQQKP